MGNFCTCRWYCVVEDPIMFNHCVVGIQNVAFLALADAVGVVLGLSRRHLYSSAATIFGLCGPWSLLTQSKSLHLLEVLTTNTSSCGNACKPDVESACGLCLHAVQGALPTAKSDFLLYLLLHVESLFTWIIFISDRHQAFDRHHGHTACC